MPRFLLITCAATALLYLALSATLFVFQRALIYFPQAASEPQGASRFTLAHDGEQLQITTRQVAGPGALLYFGGNAEDVNNSLPGLLQAYPDQTLYLMHYRGYGGSTGQPSEAALVGDALALFDRVYAEHPRIMIVGRSLGV
mgnify:FL=1